MDLLDSYLMAVVGGGLHFHWFGIFGFAACLLVYIPIFVVFIVVFIVVLGLGFGVWFCL